VDVVVAGEFEELQPLTPKATQHMKPANTKVLNKSERLRKPVNARNARGPRKANVILDRDRDSRPVEYGLVGFEDAVSAMETVTL
jgi:hypothetical protein